jgi:hypothetical protein
MVHPLSFPVKLVYGGAMIKSFQNRPFEGVALEGYRNLGTKDPNRQWSFKASTGPDKNKKVAEGDSVTLHGVTPFVRESTRARLVAAKANPGTGKGAQGFREVHAWLVGTVGAPVFPTDSARQICYRPFERGEFFYADTGETFTGAEAVVFHTDGKVYAL